MPAYSVRSPSSRRPVGAPHCSQGEVRAPSLPQGAPRTRPSRLPYVPLPCPLPSCPGPQAGLSYFSPTLSCPRFWASHAGAHTAHSFIGLNHGTLVLSSLTLPGGFFLSPPLLRFSGCIPSSASLTCFCPCWEHP